MIVPNSNYTTNIGLVNVQRQLELTYRDYNLDVQNNCSSFKVNLSINLIVMSKYSCIIVEDEPLAADVLTDYINKVSFLELKGTCTDAIFAMEKLQSEKIDLMFLDIHLPKLKGLEFLEALKSPPGVIITSAYKEYALQGFELNVIDYLLKPIRFNRFLKAVNKLNQHNGYTVTNPTTLAAPERKFIFFNVGKKRVKIFLDEILYIESLREYVRNNYKRKKHSSPNFN
jgi:DNA-binding LytR/AlgR family response regulator